VTGIVPDLLLPTANQIGEAIMGKTDRQWYKLTVRQLAKLTYQDKHPEAILAWDLTRAIREIGGGPKVYYSETSGFRVIDEHDLGKTQLSRTMESISQPYQ
jgi:hypothetical protein